MELKVSAYCYFVIDKNPPPGNYNLPSNFTKDPKKGFNFGVGRDAFEKVVIIPGAKTLSLAPGPGTYNTNRTPGSDSPKFSMRVRTPSIETNVTQKLVPGPGNYDIIPGISPKGQFSYSKYKNSAATLFNPLTSTRFKETSIRYH